METTGTPTQATPNTEPAQGTTPLPGSAGQAGGDKTPGASTGAIKEAAAEARRKLKIGDEEVDEEEVFKVYKDRKGHQRAANKELQEGLKAKRQAEEFISMMKDKQKLFDALRKLGHDPRQLSEEYLAGVLEEEMLDPREKELREAKNKLRSYEDLEKKQKEEANKRRDEALKKKYAEDYTSQFVEALKTSGVPPTKPMVAKMVPNDRCGSR
jgi:hypothetical protein